MLTAVVPFSAETPLAVALKQVTAQPQPPHEIIASIPLPLERIVLTALTKNPNLRPRDANEFRREVLATAESLGLEHAESPNVTTFERLRSAGTESPSGRLVIDLATLRQVQAATGASGATTSENPSNQTVRLDPATAKPEFHRMNVPFVAPKSRRSQLAVAGIILLIAILGSVVLAARWWRGANPNPDAGNVAASASPTPSPDGTASPSPSPTPKAQPSNRPSRRRQDKPSTAKKILNKLKGIFR
jgi:serine/threonine-protein kinase